MRFHTVYWPAFLMSAELPLPKRVFGHGFLFNSGEKMSKSVGNVIDPFDLADTYGVDQLRYFFMREVPFGQDGNYSHEAIVNRINADLANDLGNLAQRSLSMIAKNCDATRAARPASSRQADQDILWLADALPGKARAAMEDLRRSTRPSRRSGPWWRRPTAISPRRSPGCCARATRRAWRRVLYVTAEVLRAVGILAQPFVPEAAAKLLDLLGGRAGGQDARVGRAGAPPCAPGRRCRNLQPIFPRYIEAEASDASAWTGPHGPPAEARRCSPPSCSRPGSRTASRPSTTAARASTRWRSAAITSTGGRISISSTSSTSRSCATARRSTRPSSARAATTGPSPTMTFAEIRAAQHHPDRRSLPFRRAGLDRQFPEPGFSGAFRQLMPRTSRAAFPGSSSTRRSTRCSSARSSRPPTAGGTSR